MYKITPAMVGLALLCFFLPFFTVSCGDQKIMQVNGFQLVSGTEIKIPEYNKKEKVPREPVAIAAFVAITVCLVVSLLPTKIRKVFVLAGSMLTIGILFYLKYKVESDVARESAGMILCNADIGFWGSIAFLIATVILNSDMLPTNSDQQAFRVESDKPMSLQAISVYCHQCGQGPLSDSDKYCDNCGCSLDRGRPA